MALVGSVLPEGWRKAIVAVCGIAGITVLAAMQLTDAKAAVDVILYIVGLFVGGNITEYLIKNKNNHMPTEIKEELTNG